MTTKLAEQWLAEHPEREQGSEAETFQQIFHQHGPFLWRALRSMGVSENDADDLCQEVMLVVHRKLDDFDGRSLRGWLYGICFRVAAKHRRRLSRRPEVAHGSVPECEQTGNQYRQVARRQAYSQLERILAKMPEEKRQAFILYEIEQLSLQEIAEAMNCPVKTAYWRLDSARKLVQESFARAFPDREVDK